MTLPPVVEPVEGAASGADVGEATPAPAPVRSRRALPPLAALGPAFLVLAVALAASATSLGNGFAFDDRWIIQFNQRVHSIARWTQILRESYWPVLSNGLYRPLVSIGYALQWTVGKGSPAPFHVVNVAMYAGACLAMWRLAARVLPAWAALLAGALFAAHPVHVEATGNVVGQAELACTMLLAAATSLYIGWRDAGTLGATAASPGWGRIAALGLLYAGATLYKEQGVVLPALLAAAELTVVRDARPLRARLALVRPAFTALLLVAVLLLVARWRVLGALGGDVPISVFEGLSRGERTLGMLGVVPELARLLLWPAALSADYGPSHIRFVPAWTPAAALGLAIVLGVVALAVRMRRVQPAVAFGVAWLAITYAPVSNVLLPSGIVLAERTLFAPSAGVVLAVAGLVAALVARSRERDELDATTLRIGAALLVLLVAVGTVRSALRQVVWKNNATLFPQMVEDAPYSARAHYALGGHYFETGNLKDGEQEWRIAIALDTTAWRIRLDLAERYRSAGLCDPALPLYRQVIAAVPDAERARVGLVTCLRRMGRIDEGMPVAFDALRVIASPRPGLRMLRYLRAPTDSAAEAALGVARPPMPPKGATPAAGATGAPGAAADAAAAGATPASVPTVTPAVSRTSSGERPRAAPDVATANGRLPQVARSRAGRMARGAARARDAMS